MQNCPQNISGMREVFDYEVENRKWAIEQARESRCISGVPAKAKDLIADAEDIYGFITGANASAKLRDIEDIIHPGRRDS